jgi:hypothetical protein
VNRVVIHKVFLFRRYDNGGIENGRGRTKRKALVKVDRCKPLSNPRGSNMGCGGARVVCLEDLKKTFCHLGLDADALLPKIIPNILECQNVERGQHPTWMHHLHTLAGNLLSSPRRIRDAISPRGRKPRSHKPFIKSPLSRSPGPRSSDVSSDEGSAHSLNRAASAEFPPGQPGSGPGLPQGGPAPEDATPGSSGGTPREIGDPRGAPPLGGLHAATDSALQNGGTPGANGACGAQGTAGRSGGCSSRLGPGASSCMPHSPFQSVADAVNRDTGSDPMFGHDRSAPSGEAPQQCVCGAEGVRRKNCSGLPPAVASPAETGGAGAALPTSPNSSPGAGAGRVASHAATAQAGSGEQRVEGSSGAGADEACRSSTGGSQQHCAVLSSRSPQAHAKTLDLGVPSLWQDGQAEAGRPRRRSFEWPRKHPGLVLLGRQSSVPEVPTPRKASQLGPISSDTSCCGSPASLDVHRSGPRSPLAAVSDAGPGPHGLPPSSSGITIHPERDTTVLNEARFGFPGESPFSTSCQSPMSTAEKAAVGSPSFEEEGRGICAWEGSGSSDGAEVCDGQKGLGPPDAGTVRLSFAVFKRLIQKESAEEVAGHPLSPAFVLTPRTRKVRAP